MFLDLLTLRQFVPFQRFRGNSIQLTAEVLAEVPDQVVRYAAHEPYLPMSPLYRVVESHRVLDT